MRPESFDLRPTEREVRILHAVKRFVSGFFTDAQILDLIMIFTRDSLTLRSHLKSNTVWSKFFISNLIDSAFLEYAKRRVKTDYDIVYLVISMYKLIQNLLQKEFKNTSIVDLGKSTKIKLKLRMLPLEAVKLIDNVDAVSDLAIPVNSTGHGIFDIKLFILANIDIEKLELMKKVKAYLNILQKKAKSRKNEVVSTSGMMLSTMRTLKDVIKMHVSEYCYPNVIRSLRMIERKCMCYVPKPRGIDCIYVDVSGSMQDKAIDDVPRYVIACAIALWIYRNYMCNVYMYSDYVEEVPKDKIVQTLLEIKAFGGTNIYNVIDHSKERGFKRIVIITDCEFSETEFIYGNGVLEEMNLIIINPNEDVEKWIINDIKKKVKYKINYFRIRNKEDLAKIRI